MVFIISDKLKWGGGGGKFKATYRKENALVEFITGPNTNGCNKM